jgi:hypothetical protein
MNDPIGRRFYEKHGFHPVTAAITPQIGRMFQENSPVPSQPPSGMFGVVIIVEIYGSLDGK